LSQFVPKVYCKLKLEVTEDTQKTTRGATFHLEDSTNNVMSLACQSTLPMIYTAPGSSHKTLFSTENAEDDTCLCFLLQCQFDHNETPCCRCPAKETPSATSIRATLYTLSSFEASGTGSRKNSMMLLHTSSGFSRLTACPALCITVNREFPWRCLFNL